MKFVEIYEGLLQGKKYRKSDWDKSCYIYFDSDLCKFRYYDGTIFTMTNYSIMKSNNWEEYKEFINYEKCIGCLCKFWNVPLDSHTDYGILKRIDKYEEYCFVKENGNRSRFCKPVKPEEIKFYNGEK